MGHIGPDAFPDILVGQMIVHPGVKRAWKSDEWLRYVYQRAGADPSRLAYALGNLGHAAGDVFAHTYVNLYAGDSFVLGDGETDVELRHYALESFIDRHTPPLRDAFGHSIGDPANVVRAPARFLRDALILAAPAADQYKREATSAHHLLAMRGVRQALDKAVRQAKQVGQAVAQLPVGLENQANKVGRKVHDLAGPIAQAQRAADVAHAALTAQSKLIEAQRHIV
jgi:hypothetical protein